MLKCLTCGAVFNDEDRITVPNYVPYGDRYVSEDWDGCPFCRSTDIEDCEEES
jgi:predicted Zn-ribbon and HTH transcriptional regulator